MRTIRRCVWYAAFILVFGLFLGCERGVPYLNYRLDIDERVEDLVARMTLEEKISQMRFDAPEIERLGIPRYNWWNECLHGVARAGRATVFPQAIGLAATWDTDLMYRLATVISDEARAKHHEFVRRGKRGMYQGLTFWSPNINLFRDPRWGRGMETYGEDPFLTGQMGLQFVKGLQGDHDKYLKVVATVKHYAMHSGPESNRHVFDVHVSQRDLRDTYLPHFRTCIVEGQAHSVMCAYNRYLGVPCCGSKTLLTTILREEWGFDGYIVSDCGAISDFFAYHKVMETAEESAAMAVKAGTDLNCGDVYRQLEKSVEQGLIAEEEIDIAVKRLFTARMKLGMFDPPKKVPHANISYDVVDCEKHAALADEVARESIVLLKNENNFLPLKKKSGTLAVIGPNADDVEVLLGNYNGNPSAPITPLQGITNKVGKNSEVLYALGCEWAENLPSFETIPGTVLFTTDGDERRSGLKAEYFANRDFVGEPVVTRIDEHVDFNWWDEAPLADLDDDDFGVRWSGVLIPPITGTYALGGNGFSAFRLFLEDSLLFEFRNDYHPSTRYENVFLEAKKPYRIKVEFYDLQGDAHMRLLWSVPGRDLEKEAVKIAKKADVVILVMGLSPRLEGEEMKVPVKGFQGGDRLVLGLPQIQVRLMQKIHDLGKPIVLVLLNGSAVAINWAAQNIPAILEAWYPGQAGGTAIADILFGDYNPAGRLPVTFYRSVDQLPPFEVYDMEGRTYRFFKGYPLFPFGYGLSYTRFEYSDLSVPATVSSNRDVPISVTVRNAGKVDGDEVVQLYITDVAASQPVPIRSLQGFKRIFLKSGEEKRVDFTLTPRQLSLVDDQGVRMVESGLFEIAIGGKQPGATGLADASTTGIVVGQFKVIGDVEIID